MDLQKSTSPLPCQLKFGKKYDFALLEMPQIKSEMRCRLTSPPQIYSV